MEKITNTKKRKNYSNICLNSEEVLMLEKNPLITISSHGHNHQNLKILSDDEVKYEITKYFVFYSFLVCFLFLLLCVFLLLICYSLCYYDKQDQNKRKQ